MRKLSVWAIIIATVGMVACKKDDPKPVVIQQELEVKTQVFDARAYDKWVYFSFVQDKIVEIENFSTSLDWDIAFHRFDVRTNSGASGPGQGGSINMGKVAFDAIGEAPLEGYVPNDSISIIPKAGDWMNPVRVPGDTVMATWMHFSGPPPQYLLSNEIFVLKTAEGKYVKIWLKDYYNDNAESGFVSMQYLYQKDGSRHLK